MGLSQSQNGRGLQNSWQRRPVSGAINAITPPVSALQPQSTVNTPGPLGFITHLSEGEHSPENLEVSQQEGIRKKTCDKIWSWVK